MRKDEILARFLQDLAKKCIILAEILQDLEIIALLLQVSFKILMFFTRFFQELPGALNAFYRTKRVRHLKYALKNQLNLKKKTVEITSHPLSVH